MLPSYLTTFWHRVTSPRRHHRSQHCSVPLVQLTGRSPRQLPPRIRQCPVAMKYLRLLEPLNWRHFPNRRAGHYRGVRPASRVPFVAAYLVKIDQQLRSMGALNRYLREHPALAWLLGFDLRTGLPAERTWARTLRQLHNQSRQFLLDQSIQAIWRALPSCPAGHPLADAVALDTKHILAWVKENNLKESIPDRFNKERQPKGDPDCKLGCKERHNQPRRHTLSVPTPTIEAQPASGISVGTFYWGYASGIVVTKLARVGDIVLAEYTQPFNVGETTFFFPLMTQVERRLGRRPRFGALDAAFDAFYIYDYFHEAGGFAAIPLAKRGKTSQLFSQDQLPLCPAGLAMPIKHTFVDHHGLVPQPKARYACPLVHPLTTDQPCPIDHAKRSKGGCVVTLGSSPGARIRHQLNRQSEDYKRLYRQRTAAERIFSQAKALGIERPKLRNQASIANYNTLIDILINLHARQRLLSSTQLAC